MFELYRKKMSMVASIIPPIYKQSERGTVYTEKHGTLFISMLPATAEGKYDNSKKMTFGISNNDLPMLYQFFSDMRREEVAEMALIHDPEASSNNKAEHMIKTFSLKKQMGVNKQGKKVPTFMISLNYTKNKQPMGNINTAMGLGEMLVFEEYVKQSFSLIMGIKLT